MTGADIGETELNIYRPYDDVIKEVSAEDADVGETLTYTITIAPNETGADLDYEIEDVLPAGVTYVPGSLIQRAQLRMPPMMPA